MNTRRAMILAAWWVLAAAPVGAGVAELRLDASAVAEVLEEDESQATGDTFERPFDSLRESLKKTITKMRDEGLVRPEKFIDKPIDPDELIEAVKELIGE